MQTFREWRVAKGREQWAPKPHYGIGQDPYAYYCPNHPVPIMCREGAGEWRAAQ